MKRSYRRICLAITIILVCCLTTGCLKANEPGTLQEYVMEDEKMMDELLEFAKEKGLSDLIIEGDRMIFVYSYENEFTEEQIKRIGEELEKELQNVSHEFAELAMNVGEAIEVDDIMVTVEYKDGAGKEILSKDYTAKDLKESDD